jgi:hypothetical protein
MRVPSGDMSPLLREGMRLTNIGIGRFVSERPSNG